MHYSSFCIFIRSLLILRKHLNLTWKKLSKFNWNYRITSPRVQITLFMSYCILMARLASKFESILCHSSKSTSMSYLAVESWRLLAYTFWVSIAQRLSILFKAEERADHFIIFITWAGNQADLRGPLHYLAKKIVVQRHIHLEIMSECG